MTANLAILSALAVLIVGVGVAVYRAGRRSEQATHAEDTADAAKRVAGAVGNAPADRSELVDRLRRGGGL